MFEISETGKISGLEPLYKSKFIFALENGSCGVYDGKKRLWRLKGKYQATSIFGLIRKNKKKLTKMFVVIGWQNGKVEVIISLVQTSHVSKDKSRKFGGITV